MMEAALIAYSQRFWKKVEMIPFHSCWEWMGSKDSDGYGRFWINKKAIPAHRFSWSMVNGPIPEHDSAHGFCVCHHCDNPSCVNPAHLFLGTIIDNIQDKIRKGRGRKGRK